MEKERISYWRNRPTWTIYDLVFLLREREPKPYDDLESDIKQELVFWTDWALGCPELNSFEKAPMTTLVNAKKLLAWASSLDGVEIPDCWRPLMETENQPIEPRDGNELPVALGIQEKENLLLTIGALALALAHESGRRNGTPDKPNIKQLALTCTGHAGEASGMACSTVRNRISEGIRILKERR